MPGWNDLLTVIQIISRAKPSGADLERAVLLIDAGLPWDSVFALAQIHGVAGFLHEFIEAAHAKPPADIQEAITREYSRTRENGRKIHERAAAITEVLHSKGIEAICIQGLSIGHLYADPGLRPMGDADLLVKDIGEVKKALAQYAAPDPLYPNIFNFDGVWFDFHTHPLNAERIHARRHIFPQDISRFRANARPASKDTPCLLIPDQFDNFPALCAHALKHSYSRLIWLSDIERLFLWLNQNEDMAADRLVEISIFWKQEKPVLYALLLIQELFGTQIPEAMLIRLGVEKMSFMEKHLINLKIRGFESQELCNALWFFMLKGPGVKAQFFLETLFPRQDIMDQIYMDDVESDLPDNDQPDNNQHPRNNPKKKRLIALVKRTKVAVSLAYKNVSQALRLTLKP